MHRPPRSRSAPPGCPPRSVPTGAYEALGMKMLVLGAGLQGSACAFELLQGAGVGRVTLADLPGTPLAPFLVPFAGDRLQLQTLDVTDRAAVHRVMTGHDAVMSAIPYYYNGPLSAAAVDCGCHWADLGGNTEIVIEQ